MKGKAPPDLPDQFPGVLSLQAEGASGKVGVPKNRFFRSLTHPQQIIANLCHFVKYIMPFGTTDRQPTLRLPRISAPDTRRLLVHFFAQPAPLLRTALKAALDGTFRPVSCADIPECASVYPGRPSPLIRKGPSDGLIPASEPCRYPSLKQFLPVACRTLRYRSSH